LTYAKKIYNSGKIYFLPVTDVFWYVGLLKNQEKGKTVMEQLPLTDAAEEKSVFQKTIQEITQPFKDLIHASRALWGVNIAYFLEGMTYFGVLSLLAL